MKKIGSVILGILFAAVVLVILMIIFWNIYHESFALVYIFRIISLSTLSSLVLFFAFKKFKYFATSQLLVSSVFFLYVAYNQYQVNKVDHIEHWTAKKNSFTKRFICDSQGRPYLEGTVNGETGWFLFDTGASRTAIHEKFNPEGKHTLKKIPVKDVQNKVLNRSLFAVQKLSFDSVAFEHLNVLSLRIKPLEKRELLLIKKKKNTRNNRS